MDLAIKLVELEKRTAQHRELLLTEEAAKTALVMPFLQALGYDVFNPSEVVPEFTADVATKKGEKVDYALCIDGKVSILVECKPSSVELNLKHAGQLFRYFSVTDARVAVLTNGVVYQFYSDIEQPNRMDDKPFFVFSMDAIRRSDPATLERFARANFSIEAIVAEAGRLKLESQLRIELEREFAEPSPEPIEEGRSDDPSHGDGIVTTEEEIGGFRIIQAIATRQIDPSRVVMRDSLSYCAVLLDDNNRKTLARMHFNSPTTKYLGTFAGKAETRHRVAALNDLYKHEAAILARIAELDGKSGEAV